MVEGYFAGTLVERKETAAFLRTLGAISVGRVTPESYLKAFETLKAAKPGESKD
jgi:hypothetical protein